MKRKLILLLIFLMISGMAFGESISSLLYLNTSVLPLNTLSFYQLADGSSKFANNTLSMGDQTDYGNHAIAYLVATSNNNGALDLTVELPAMEWVDDGSNILAVGTVLPYTTTISKYSATSDTDVTLGDSLTDLPNSAAPRILGTINGHNGRQKGVYQFDFVVSSNDYWGAFQGAYEATVSVTMKTQS